MQILINEKNIPFELGSEKNAADVVASLQLYANQKKLVFHDIRVNGEEKPLSDASTGELQALLISAVKQISCRMENPAAYGVSMLLSIGKKLEVFGKAYTREQIINNFSDIIARLDWTQEVLEKCSNLLALGDALNVFQQNIQQLRLLAYTVRNEEKPWDADKANRLSKQISDGIDGFQLKLQTLVLHSILSREDADIKEIVAYLIFLLQLAQKECETIATEFQSGKPLKGLSAIVTLVDCIETVEKGGSRLIALDPAYKKNFNEGSFSTMLEKLEEIKTLLENEDFVELSDVLEYVLQPSLKAIEHGLSTSYHNNRANKDSNLDDKSKGNTPKTDDSHR